MGRLSFLAVGVASREILIMDRTKLHIFLLWVTVIYQLVLIVLVTPAQLLDLVELPAFVVVTCLAWKYFRS